MIPQIRAELAVLHGLLKHKETAAEQVAQEKIGHLHDGLARAEAHIAAVSVSILRELRNLAVSAEAKTLEIVDAALAYADKRKVEIDAANNKNAAAVNEAAAKVALAVAEEKAAPAPAV